MLRKALLFRLFQSALGEGIKIQDKDEGRRYKNYTLASLSSYTHLSQVTSSVERKLTYSLTACILIQNIMKKRTGSKMIPLIAMATGAAVLST